MAQRSRPNRRDPSSTIALWKDPVGGTREIPLEAGAQGVLLTASVDLTVRRSGDGRRPVENCMQFFDVSIFQVRAATGSSPTPRAPTGSPPAEPRLEPEELTILRSWAEAVAEVLASAPEQLDRTLAEIGGDGRWRARLAIEEWSSALTETFQAMRRLLTDDALADVKHPLDRAIAAVQAERPGAPESETMARDVLQLALEQRRIRHLNLGLSLAGDRD
jgi:hypothetical protein